MCSTLVKTTYKLKITIASGKKHVRESVRGKKKYKREKSKEDVREKELSVRGKRKYGREKCNII
jgi:hypothetical protein